MCRILVDLPDYLLNQRLLAAEVIHDDAFANARSFGDLRKRCLGIARCRNRLDSALDDLCAPGRFGKSRLFLSVWFIFCPHGQIIIRLDKVCQPFHIIGRNILLAVSVYTVRPLLRCERSRMDFTQTRGTQQAVNQSPATVLYQQHARTVFLYLRRHILSREDAEDLLLEVFLCAVEKQTPLAFPEERQRAWLLRVARDKLIDYHRRNARRPHVSLDDMTIETLLADEEHGPEQHALRDEDYLFLRQRFAALPEHYQQVLWLRFAYGLHTKVIAQRLQKSDGAIRILLARALNNLRSIYEHRQGDVRHDT